MSDAPLILGVSGLRGIVGESLTPEVAVRYAAAFGRWLRSETGDDSPRVMLGRDGRRGGEGLQVSVVRGLLHSGCSVELLGVCSTPTVGFAVDELGAAAGIVLTASHNPQQWNGVKILVRGEGGAAAPDAGTAAKLIERFHAMGPVALDGSGEPSEVAGATALHMERVRDVITPMMDRATVGGLLAVTDSVNSSGGTASRELAASLGFGLSQLHADDSGIFPHTPEPTRENLSGEGGLCDAVPGLKADVGFAQDPDADRLAIVDERGEYIGEEYTLALCAMSVLEALSGPSARAEGSSEADAREAVLVTNLSTSRMIEDVAAKFGARVERTAVGEANVVERMLALKQAGERVVLGGEGNGGVIWPEVVYVRDSLGSMALVLALMARTGKTVSGLVTAVDALSAGGGGYEIVKRKVEIGSKADAEPAVAAVASWAAGIEGARIDRQDGVRVDFDRGAWAGSWVHVRASNTEPIMRLICEAPSDGVAAEVLGAVEGAIG